MAGEVKVRRGNVYFAGREFAIEQGEIIFTGTESFDPTLNLKASRTIRATRSGHADAKVSVDVTGTFQKPEFWLAYDAEGREYAGLGQSEIMELLVLDVTAEDMDDMTSGALASKTSRDFVRRMAEARLSRAVRAQTGLDVFEIDTSALGAESGTRYTRMTLGKYMNQSLFLSYTTEYTEEATGAGERERSAEAEYRLFKDFYLVGSTFEDEDRQRYGLGLRYFYEY